MIGLCKTQTIDENLCVWLEVLNVSGKISITLNSPPRSECLFNACLSAPFKNVSLVSPENEFNDSSGSFIIFALCSFFTLESSLVFTRACGGQSERQTLLLMLFFAIWHSTLIFREMSSSRQSKKSTRSGMRSRAPSPSSNCKREKNCHKNNSESSCTRRQRCSLFRHQVLLVALRGKCEIVRLVTLMKNETQTSWLSCTLHKVMLRKKSVS